MDANVREKIYNLLGESLKKCLDTGDISVCSDDAHIKEYVSHISDIIKNETDSIADDEFNMIIKDIENRISIYAAAAKRLLQNDSLTDEAILKAKEDWVTVALEMYFEKWIRKLSIPRDDGSDEGKCISYSYPYYLNDESYKKGRNESICWKKLKEFFNKLESNIITEEAVEKKEENDFRIIKVRGKCDYQSYKEGIDTGKALPEILKKIADIIEDSKGDLKSFISDANENECENFRTIYNNKSGHGVAIMEYLGIGVDCSAFVSRALATVFEKLQYSLEDQRSSIGPHHNLIPDKLLRTNMSEYRYTIPKRYVHKKEWTEENREEARETERITYDGVTYDFKKGQYYPGYKNVSHLDSAVRCSNIRPGDILQSKKHVKIISEVIRDNNGTVTYYTTMESGSSWIKEKDNNAEPPFDKIKERPGVIKRTKKVKDDEKLSKDTNDFGNNYYVYRAPILTDFYGILAYDNDILKENPKKKQLLH